MSAAGILVMIPIFVLSLFIRKYFVEGMTMGAVK
jgi:multiple sugar transport system permease protein